MTAGYRGDGLRAWKQTQQGRTYYVYDGSTPILELSASGSVSATNTFGASGLISRRSGSSTIFYAFDPQGSVAELMGADGLALVDNIYAAHGADAHSFTSGGVNDEATPWGFGAQWGYYTDTEAGLQLLTNRYYDPQGGRFLTRDPIGYRGGINLYSYVENDLVNFIDPSGLDSVGLIGGGSLLGGIMEASGGGQASGMIGLCGSCNDGRGAPVIAASAGGLLFPETKPDGQGQQGVLGLLGGVGGGVFWYHGDDCQMEGPADSYIFGLGPFALQADAGSGGTNFSFTAGKSFSWLLVGFAHFKSKTWVLNKGEHPVSHHEPPYPGGPVPMPLPTPTPTR